MKIDSRCFSYVGWGDNSKLYFTNDPKVRTDHILRRNTFMQNVKFCQVPKGTKDEICKWLSSQPFVQKNDYLKAIVENRIAYLDTVYRKVNNIPSGKRRGRPLKSYKAGE